MSKINLTQPTRQSAKGLVLIFLQSIRSAIRMFWAPIGLLVIQRNIFENKAIIPIILVVLFVLLIVHTIFYYLHFYYYVKNDEFILKKGYLRKKVLTIPIERIQSINTKQNLIQQVLDIVALEIDTAGTAGKELKIHALERAYAEELYQLLNSGRESEVAKGKSEEIAEEAEKADKTVLTLTPVDLLKIGISQNHFRTAMIILAFGYQIFDQAQELFRERAEEYSNELVQHISESSVTLIVILVIFFLIISILFSLFRTLFKYFDFKLQKKGNAYQIEAGLLNKRTVVVPHTKIQEISWATNPLKKLFGIYHITFKQAVSKQDNQIQLVDAPGCLNQHLELLKNDLFGTDELNDQTKHFSNKQYFRVLWMSSGWLPAMLISPFLFSEWIFWLAAAGWILLTAGYNQLVLQKRYFQLNNNQIRVSAGAISQKWKQMELYKIQSVSFKQSIFHKRRSLATIHLMNASGSITIPYINEDLARQIYDYLLYHTETSTKKWM